MENTIKSENSSDPDQAQHFLSGLIWVQTVCKGYQQMTIEGKELRIQACVLSTIISWACSNIGHTCSAILLCLYFD